MHGQLALARLTRQAMPIVMNSSTSTLWLHCLLTRAGQLTLSPTPVSLSFFSDLKYFFMFVRALQS
jgi:hypothetical protein